MNIPFNIREYLVFVMEEAFSDRNAQCIIKNNGISIFDMVSGIDLEVDFNHYQKVIDEVNQMTIHNMTLFDESCCEVVLRNSFDNSYTKYPHHLMIGFHGIKSEKVKLNQVSERYLIFFIYKLAENKAFFPYLRDLGKTFFKNKNNRTLYDFLSVFGDGLFAINGSGAKEEDDLDEIYKQIDYFLYLLSKQNSAMLSRISDVIQLQPGVPYGNQNNLILAAYEQIDVDKVSIFAPRELFTIYQTAFSSTSPDHQFLSFYRILEHQLFSSFYDTTLKNLLETIDSEDFSKDRVQTIDNALKNIIKSTSYEGSDIRIREIDALTEVILRYKVFSHIVDKISQYNDDLIGYYRKNRVEFSSGDTVDLTAENLKSAKRLANRIYSIRNSIVHNKILSKNRYNVMSDEIHLRPEVVLVRCIAEIIIENYRQSTWDS